MIYFDNAATTYTKPESVAKAVYDALLHMGNEGRGASRASLLSSMQIFEVRQKLAHFFHAKKPDQVAFTSGSTESLNIAILGSFKPGDHVITTALEHNSVLRPLYLLQEQGLELTIIGMDEKGRISPGDITSHIRSNTKGLVINHGSNVTGELVDLSEIGKIAKENKLRFIVDGSQTAGVFPIDMEAMDIDILCFTGHKSLYGPQGTGGIIVREGIDLTPLKVGGSGVKTFEKKHPDQMPTRLEAGTLNGHGIVGLGAGIDYIQEKGIHELRNKALECMWRFYDGLSDIEGVKIYGDFTNKQRCPIVALNIGSVNSSKVGDALSQGYDIAVRTGGHCAPLVHQGLGTNHQGAVRFSFSHFNTMIEVDQALQAIRDLVE